LTKLTSKNYNLTPELKFLPIKAQINSKINFSCNQNLHKFNKNLIEPINIWFWTFLPQIEFSWSTGLSSVNKILPNFILVILNLLNQFLTIFRALWHPFFSMLYFFDFFVFYYFLCEDPKIDYNKSHHIIIK
jgi:hypothetical protein